MMLANSFIPFILHPPASNHIEAIRDAMAADIQRELETYWPTMKKQNEDLVKMLARILDDIEDVGSYNGSISDATRIEAEDLIREIKHNQNYETKKEKG